MFQAIADKASQFFAGPQTDTRRIFHGRGHLHPGLEHINIDWYPPVCLITTYAEIEDTDALSAAILPHDRTAQIQCLLLQYRNRKGTPAISLLGEMRQQTVVTENGLRFEVQPGVNQNAGLFLDMSPLRSWLKANSDGKNLLNLFAYTCSLSVAALAGHANQVVSVDMSRPSIRWGERNHALNRHDMDRVRSIPHNLFRSWGRIKQFGRYDTIIIDPPSRQRGSFDAEKNYGAVLKKLSQLAKPGADVIATINSPYLGEDFLPHLFNRWAPKCSFVEMMPVAPEFADKFPERGLKIYHFRSA